MGKNWKYIEELIRLGIEYINLKKSQNQQQVWRWASRGPVAVMGL